MDLFSWTYLPRMNIYVRSVLFISKLISTERQLWSKQSYAVGCHESFERTVGAVASTVLIVQTVDCEYLAVCSNVLRDGTLKH